MTFLQQRAAILFEFGASVQVADELLAYTQPLTQSISKVDLGQILAEPEPHVAAWQSLPREGAALFSGLQRFFYQLCFPIKAGVGETAVYKAAVLQGKADQLPNEPERLQLQQPAQLQLDIYPSLVGDVPILTTAERADFVTLVQAFGHKNEPAAVAESMGAALVSGRVNWHRFNQLRTQWLNGRLPDPFTETLWRQELQTRIIPNKPLYRDTFIILSSGIYSGVAAEKVGLNPAEWQKISYTIRLVHEAIHYSMRRLGIARPNHLQDELLADFWGIMAAVGHFQASWFCEFMGLHPTGHPREDGRIHLYRGSLSDDAFHLLQKLLIQAANQLEQMSKSTPIGQADAQQQRICLLALSTLTLEQLASPRSLTLLNERMSQLSATQHERL